MKAQKLNRYFSKILILTLNLLSIEVLVIFSKPPHPTEVLWKEKNSTS